MKVNGEVLADLILRDIEDNINIGSCESSWVIADIGGFVVEVKITDRDYWVEDNCYEEPKVKYGAGAVDCE